MTGDGGFIGVSFLSHSDERAIAREAKLATAMAEAFSEAMRAIEPQIAETARSIEALSIALLGWESPARWRRFRQELLRRTGARLDANEREVERCGR